MKIGAIIQARTGSKRLPYKHFYKINNKPIIFQLIKRLKKISLISEIIIATTKSKNDDKFIEIAKKNKVKIYRGKDKDCLNRIYKAALFSKLDIIVFITGDCPVFDYRIVKKILFIFLKGCYDYVGNSFIRTFPDGMDAHVFSFNTLKKIEKLCKTKNEREHVTLGIKKNFKIFKIYNLKAENKNFWPSLALTLDTIEDFILIKKVISHFNKKKNYFFSCTDAIKFLKKKKNLVKINQHIKRISNFL